MFGLIPWRKVSRNTFWIAIHEDIRLSFIVDGKVNDLVVCLVSYKKFKTQNDSKFVHLLVHDFWFETDLHLIVFKQGIFRFEVARYESSQTLISCYLFHDTFKLTIFVNSLALISFLLWVGIWRIDKNLGDSAFGHWFTKFRHTAFFHSTNRSPGFTKAFIFWKRF